MEITPYVFKAIGVAGILLITYGIFSKKETSQDLIFALGGGCLLIYSIYLRDPVFIPLQIIFTGASLYELATLHRQKK